MVIPQKQETDRKMWHMTLENIIMKCVYACMQEPIKWWIYNKHVVRLYENGLDRTRRKIITLFESGSADSSHTSVEFLFSEVNKYSGQAPNLLPKSPFKLGPKSTNNTYLVNWRCYLRVQCPLLTFSWIAFEWVRNRVYLAFELLLLLDPGYGTERTWTWRFSPRTWRCPPLEEARGELI